MQQVLVLCSGVGSRMEKFTKYTNKALIPAGKKPALSHIFDQYDTNNTEFIVTLGHFGDHVRQYISIAHPELNVKFVEVEDYKRSILHSIDCARPYLTGEFWINPCDSFQTRNPAQKSDISIGEDVLLCFHYGYNSYDHKHYRGVDRNGELVEKGDNNNLAVFTGISYIQNYEKFWEVLDKLKTDRSNSDFDIFKNCRFLIDYISFYDVGNPESYEICLKDKYTGILPKQGESIFFIDDKVIKFFSDKQIVKNRVKRAKLLYDVVPKIIDKTDNFYSYEKVEASNFSHSINPFNFEDFLCWMNREVWGQNLYAFGEYDDSGIIFYKDKTNSRIKEFLKNNEVPDEIFINGKRCWIMKEVTGDTDSIDCSWMSDTRFYGNFHGDLNLDNILFSEDNGFTLIDWRQDFAGHFIGDQRYDIAKLNHSLQVSHQIINDECYMFYQNNGEIKIDIYQKKNLLDCQKVLKSFCKSKGFNWKEIEVITALIWINMAPLHDGEFGNFLFYLGQYTLNSEITE